MHTLLSPEPTYATIAEEPESLEDECGYLVPMEKRGRGAQPSPLSRPCPRQLAILYTPEKVKVSIFMGALEEQQVYDTGQRVRTQLKSVMTAIVSPNYLPNPRKPDNEINV